MRLLSRPTMLLIAALPVGAGAFPVRAQSRLATGAVDGVVTDTNLVSLAGASVSILGSGIRVVTGDNGRFRILRLPAGQYIVVAHRLGYVPASTVLQVVEGDTLRTAFVLERIVTSLDTVVVVAKRHLMRMGEFEARRALGIGHFVTQGDIEQRNSAYVADLLRPILSIGIEGRGSTQIAYNLREGCAMQVFVDGIPLPRAPNLADLPSPRDLAGIEVYAGAATIPLQYQRANSGCGVILVWTKDGS
jgi:hypothetical protein